MITATVETEGPLDDALVKEIRLLVAAAQRGGVESLSICARIARSWYCNRIP